MTAFPKSMNLTFEKLDQPHQPKKKKFLKDWFIQIRCSKDRPNQYSSKHNWLYKSKKQKVVCFDFQLLEMMPI